jgi:hypothetical protein
MSCGTELSDAERWLSLFLRHACAPNWSIKTLALSSPSIRTIAARMYAEVWTISEEETLRREVSWQTAMIKAGMRLGLNSREIRV